jgi:hypothetical protein
MYWRIFGGNWQGEWSPDHFHLPLLLSSIQEGGSDFPHPTLKRAGLQWLIVPGEAALQLQEDIAAAPFRIGLEPGQDLLPLPRNGVIVGAPPAQYPFSPLLFSVQGLES